MNLEDSAAPMPLAPRPTSTYADLQHRRISSPENGHGARRNAPADPCGRAALSV